MNASVSGRESLNGAAEPGRDLLEIDVFDGTKSARAKIAAMAASSKRLSAVKSGDTISISRKMEGDDANTCVMC
jgi:hypothetical protein